MMRHWVWLIIVGMATWAGAQPQVTIEGRLKGYFLAPDGTLKVYEVPFKFPESPSPSDLPDRLFPLWAGYYLQAKLVSSIPIQSVWLLSGNGRLLWRRHYPEGAKEETIDGASSSWRDDTLAGGWVSGSRKVASDLGHKRGACAPC